VAIQDGHVVRGTSDGYLLALDAADGELLWTRQVADPSIGETFSMAPLIYGDRIFIGPAVSEYGIQGWLGAFSLSDGAPIWRFETVPGARGGGDQPWPNPTGIPLGGGAIWTPLSMDVQRNEIYLSVSNPAPDLPAFLRPGPNLYTNSMVALNPDSGELLWYRQLVSNDDHDWDLTQVSPVFSIPLSEERNGTVGGGTPMRDIAATAGRDGMLRLVDRDSREVI
jgi:alcohol dehydrogenase (cytochrome c)